MTPSQRVSAVFAEQFEQQPDLLVRSPRPRQPHRRAHRLQRRLRAALRHRLRDLRRHRPPHRQPGARGRRRLRQPARSVQPGPAHRPSSGSTLERPHPRRGQRAHKGRGYQLRGLNMVVSGNVPQGPGFPFRLPGGGRPGLGRRRDLTSARPRSPPQRPTGGEPVRRLQLRHHGSDDLRERREGSRPAAGLPLPWRPASSRCRVIWRC